MGGKTHSSGSSSVAKDQIRKLDGMLPEDVNRRRFLSGVTGSVIAGLAGCLGDNDTGGDTGGDDTGGDDTGDDSSADDDAIIQNVVWRSAWAADPGYAPGYAAELQGFWTDQNISPPSVQRGYGSGDTTRRIGTGEESLGMSSIGPQVAGLGEGFDLKIIATAKARSMSTFYYRDDEIDDPTQLEGKTVLVQSASNRDMWPVYVQAAGVEGDHNLEFAQEATAASMLESNDAQGVFGTINDIPRLLDSIGDTVSLGVDPLYRHRPIYGYTVIGHGDWLDDNVEYASRIITGYSAALKWVILNPEEAIDMMTQDVNQALQTTDRETLINMMNAGVAATNLADGIRDNGFAYLDEDKVDESIQVYGEVMDAPEIPSLEDSIDLRPMENAELTVPSSDEWSQIMESAQPYSDWYE